MIPSSGTISPAHGFWIKGVSTVKIINGVAEFEYLAVVSASNVGAESPVTARHAMCELTEADLREIEKRGREVAAGFNRHFDRF